MSAGGFAIDRGQVLLDKPIKMLGLNEVRINLHPEVTAKVSMNVARSEDEATRQAKGEDVMAVRDEAPEFQTFDENAVFEEGARPSDEAGADAGGAETSAKS